LLQKTLQWLERLSAEVREKAGDYPKTAIAGYVFTKNQLLGKSQVQAGSPLLAFGIKTCRSKWRYFF
jgi:hypothetical protein